MGEVGKRNSMFLNKSIFIAHYILSGQMWLYMDFVITLSDH